MQEKLSLDSLNDCPYLVVENLGSICEIQFNRPETKNAINFDMYAAMGKALRYAEEADSVRSVLFKGSDGCFTSGNDLHDFLKLNDLGTENNPLLDFMKHLSVFTKPVIAAVDGYAVGIGTTMLLHCDFIVASEKASFSMPFTKLGLCPEYAASLLLPRMMGHVKAVQYLLFGESMAPQEAERLGLINVVSETALDEARMWAKKLDALSPLAVRESKALLKAAPQTHLEQVMMREIDKFSALLKGPEFAEAAAAFFEKRPAKFD